MKLKPVYVTISHLKVRKFHDLERSRDNNLYIYGQFNFLMPEISGIFLFPKTFVIKPFVHIDVISCEIEIIGKAIEVTGRIFRYNTKKAVRC